MEIVLYHYVHCPFCIRVRMTLGLLGLDYRSEVLAYDDEKTPVELSGVKMLPILCLEGKMLNESLQIMQELDQGQRLQMANQIQQPKFAAFEAYLNLLGSPIHSLAMPYWIYTPEFDQNSRKYFQNKKEEKRGPFKLLVQQRNSFLNKLSAEFPHITAQLSPYYGSTELGLYDILLASHLWGLYVVPEFQFPEAIHLYLQRVKNDCRFEYHQDFWS